MISSCLRSGLIFNNVGEHGHRKYFDSHGFLVALKVIETNRSNATLKPFRNVNKLEESHGVPLHRIVNTRMGEVIEYLFKVRLDKFRVSLHTDTQRPGASLSNAVGTSEI